MPIFEFVVKQGASSFPFSVF